MVTDGDVQAARAILQAAPIVPPPNSCCHPPFSHVAIAHEKLASAAGAIASIRITHHERSRSTRCGGCSVSIRMSPRRGLRWRRTVFCLDILLALPNAYIGLSLFDGLVAHTVMPVDPWRIFGTDGSHGPFLIGPIDVLRECAEPPAYQLAGRCDQFHDHPTSKN
jgi:hypothetical protein